LTRTLSLLALLSLTLAGCAGASAGTTPTHSPQTLSWAIAGQTDVPTLDPALVSDPTSITVASLIYGGLVRLDSHLRVQPDGASHWTISRTGTVYTFYLRPDLRFPNGRFVTASDFASALRRALGPAGSAGAASFYLGSILHRSAIVRGETQTQRGITVVDAHTLRITLTHPSARFLSELAFPASFVAEPDLLDRFGPNWTDRAAGFGPYRVKRWQHTQSLSLVPNPYYWGGKPTFRRIVFHFYPGAAAAETAYRDGKVDVISGLPAGQPLPTNLDGARSMPALALDYLAFNTTRLPFYRLHARQAFAAAWRPSLVRASLGSAAFPATGFLPPALGVATAPAHLDPSPAADLKAARYRNPDAFPRVVLAVPRDPGLIALGNALSTAWARTLRVDIGVRPLDPSVYNQVLSTRSFDLAIVRWGFEYADPQDFLGTQLGSSSENVTGWSTRQYDAAVALADSYNPADPRRATLFRRAAELAARKVPLLPLDEPAIPAVFRPGLHGVSLTALGTVVVDPTTARLG
jgi:ABC-type oligopeptide transport system substrate-binding subunit